MKDLVNKLIGNLHWFVLLYGLYGGWVLYDEHSVQLEEIQNQLPSIEAEIVTTEKKVKEIQEFVKKTDEYKVRVEEVAKTIESVQRQLPPDINDTQILTYFSEEMSFLNMKDAALNPGKEDRSTYFISKDFLVKAKGTFLQFLIFFERIGNAERIYNVKKLKISVSGINQKGRFQIVEGEGIIQAYRLNPDFRVDRGFDNQAQPGGKP
jgi:Tfp pilus assembly protein PilO